MTVRDLINAVVDAWHDSGPSEAATEFYYRVLVGAKSRFIRAVDYGTPIYEEEWDLLLVLDGCRVDAMRTVASEYDFIDEVDVRRSVAGHSIQWMERTFDDERKFSEEVAYVTANPFSERVLSADQFVALEEVWRDGWDEDHGTVLPRTVTNRVIDCFRSGPDVPVVAHYMQPHVPFIESPVGEAMNRDETEIAWEEIDNAWKLLQRGQVSEHRVWDAYIQNLRVALDDIELLLENIDADRVVITADHGNAAGEWRMYGHGDYNPVATVRRVPWCETSGTDNRTYEPNIASQDVDSSVEERLERLGYR